MGHFSGRLREVFPEGDPYDCIIPPKTLGSWIKNQRLRRGLEQKELARRLGVHVFSLVRYERDEFRPDLEIRRRLTRQLGPGLERFLGSVTISNRARRRPASEGSRPRRSARHEAKKQADPAVQVAGRRGSVLG